VLPDNHPSVYSYNKIFDEIKKETNGRISFTMTAGGILGSEQEGYDMIRSGDVDGGMMNVSYYENYVPESQGWLMPYSFTDYHNALRYFNEDVVPNIFNKSIADQTGTIGPIIPPSIPFVVYATYAGVSTGALFMAGIVPGIFMGLVLCVMCFLLSPKNHYPAGQKYSGKEIFDSFKRSFLALLMPAIIMGGIWSGICTPTEAALVSILYALIVSGLIYREQNIHTLAKIIRDTIINTMPIMMVIASATIFSFIVSYARVDKIMLGALTSLTNNKYVILLIIDLMVLVLGMFFDNTVIVMLLTPLLIPLAGTYGISMVHLGVIVVLNAMIGLLTPPVGYSLYVLSSVTNYPVMKLAKWISPWLVPLALTLLAVTFIEPISMAFPRALGIA